ncbi:hypothetical protein [Rufibacter radiotolerans]|uniref:hypothetical protein n=1 Tax=Rufibacter radiotolerans TaxID=1379910 RepID=UPI0012E266C1|nr:hypothetical protein [Rufibacter radiotolerans]
MKKLHRTLSLLLVLVALGACEKVKDKQIAALPETSVGDTLVLEPDSVEIDTTFAEGETSPYGEYEDNSWEPVEGAVDGEDGTARNGTASNAGVSISNQNDGSSAASRVTTTTTTTTEKASASKGSTTTKATPVRKKYVRPTAIQLQKALARDARLSSRMPLTRLKNYWMTRQHYYRRASKEVKFVSGPTKIKISPEETKIETAQGKVKIEGNDIKVKPE